MKTATKKLISLMLALFLTVSLCAFGSYGAECADGAHTMEYKKVNGELHRLCSACGALDTKAENNSEGGPIVYLGTQNADGTERVSGDGFTPDTAVTGEFNLTEIFDACYNDDPKPITVVIVSPFVTQFDFIVDANAPVTFTSVWNGVDYRYPIEGSSLGSARILYKTHMHCYNDITFDSVTFEQPASARGIGLNGNDFTATNILYYNKGEFVETLEDVTAMYGILATDYLDANFVGEDLYDLDQTITVDSGIWICIDIGSYRSASSSAFLDLSGKVTVNISGTAQIINRANGAPWKFRGLSAAAQIVSQDGLDVTYNITGGKFFFKNGLNVVGRDSQTPYILRNVSATYNIYGGEFGGASVYSTVRPELTNSLPTEGEVVFNILKTIDLGEIEIDEGKDTVNMLDSVPTVTEPPVTEPPVTEPPVTEPPVTEHPADTTSAPDPTEEEGGVNIILILCIAAAVIAIAVDVVIVINKKKKANKA